MEIVMFVVIFSFCSWFVSARLEPVKVPVNPVKTEVPKVDKYKDRPWSSVKYLEDI